MLNQLLIVLLAAAPSDLQPRLETLQRHAVRLQAITVSADAVASKDAKLAEVAQALARGATDEASFDRLYREMDAVRGWLLEHSASKPQTASGGCQETEEAWELNTALLSAKIAKGDLSIEFKTPQMVWRLPGCDAKDFEIAGKPLSFLDAREQFAEEFRTGFSQGVRFTFMDFPGAEGLKVFLLLHLMGSEALFEIAATEDGAKLGEVSWPKPVEFNTQNPQDCSVIPYMQGMLLPANWPEKIHRSGLCHTRWFYMPWWGQIRDGHGIQTIIETGFDGGGSYHHPAGGPTTISPLWNPSLGALRYPRRIRYVFDDAATYVSMAKRYRRFALETGHFVSLKEKLARTPAVAEVVGRPIIHLGSLYHFVPESGLFNKERIENNHALTPFEDLAKNLKDLKAHGIEDAYVHLDGWGFRGYDSAHPDVLPVGEEQGGWEGLRAFARTCEELGYLFAVHDNYRDFYKNAVSFNEDLAIRRSDGSIQEDSTWCGGPQSFLSARFAPEYVRRNHDLFAANGIHLGGAYLDVFAVADLDESFQDSPPMSREECAVFRRQSFDLLHARGYVVSSEEPVDFAVPSIDLVHHGPYPTHPNLGGGGPSGIPVPLFNLVYHDSILLPWEMGEDGGWGIPKGDAGWLHCLLNAGLPYVGPGASEEQIKRVKEACVLAAKLADQEMVNHEFLDASRRKQRTTYADGTQVTVNFEGKGYEITEE
jgi:hypothetical protein